MEQTLIMAGLRVAGPQAGIEAASGLPWTSLMGRQRGSKVPKAVLCRMAAQEQGSVTTSGCEPVMLTPIGQETTANQYVLESICQLVYKVDTKRQNCVCERLRECNPPLQRR
jgi:hypothetical protein